MTQWQPNPREPVPSSSAAATGRHDQKSSRSSRVRRRAPKSPVNTALEWALIMLAAVGIAIVVRAFLFEPFYIPSESMVPTLEVGDRVLVNRLSYRLHDVNRGDIVVFEAPPEERTPEIRDFVKRVIGLPGDTIEVRENDGVYINGQRLEEPYLRPGTPLKDFGPVTVGPDMLFVMGDNRGESKDSREFGAIPESSVVGRVFIRYFPLGRFGFL